MEGLAALEATSLDETDPFSSEAWDGAGGRFEAALDPELGNFEGYPAFEGGYAQFEDPEGWGTAIGEGGIFGEVDHFGEGEIMGASYEYGPPAGALYEDPEADPFLGPLLRRASRAIERNLQQSGVTPQVLRQLAQQAAQVAGAAVAGPTGARIAGQVAGQVLREGGVDGELWPETDASMEEESDESGWLQEIHYQAAMAAESASDHEAQPFIGAIANLLGEDPSGEVDPYYETDPLFEEEGGDGEGGFLGERDEFLPLVAGAVKAAPLIGRGLRALGGLFSRRRRTRRLVRVLPAVARGTIADLRRLRRRPTPQQVAALMARRTARLLANRTALARTMRLNRLAAARAQARPLGARSTVFARRGLRPYGVIYGPTAPFGSRRRVVAYVMRPIYAGTPGVR